LSPSAAPQIAAEGHPGKAGRQQPQQHRSGGIGTDKSHRPRVVSLPAPRADGNLDGNDADEDVHHCAGGEAGPGETG
jgi:hypothetical protein